MVAAMCAALVVALGCALAAIVLGRNLTRSIVGGMAFLAALTFAMLIGGAGFLAMVVAILGGLMLGTLQLFGWMLVDVDRDHLPPTDRPTWFARGIAFVLFGGGLALLVGAVFHGGGFSLEGARIPAATPAEVGAFLFGPLRDATILMGLTIAASLLAVLLLLQDDGEKG
jgi:hypothetical protein